MVCQLRCCSSRGLPPLSPGERSGGAVVNRINCQSKCLDVERGNIETGIEEKRSCGIFPKSQTNTCYLPFNVLFAFILGLIAGKKIGPVGACLHSQSKDNAGNSFHSPSWFPATVHSLVSTFQSAFFSYILVNILGSLN